MRAIKRKYQVMGIHLEKKLMTQKDSPKVMKRIPVMEEYLTSHCS